jgi:hypothetical protein
MMVPIRGITVCVGYDDLLSVTLAENMRHMEECLVVTSPDDRRTKEVCRQMGGVLVHETDAFTRNGAAFNKGMAIEEGFDVLGRRGWILVWDADTMFPETLPIDRLEIGRVYGASRIILEDIHQWSGPDSWSLARAQKDDKAIGYFQLFHAADPHVRDRRPWYNPSFAHAGGCDDYFISHWMPYWRSTLPTTVLHLGPVATNWYGRASERLDGMPVPEAAERLRKMDSVIKRYDWNWARPGIDMEALEDDGTSPHRIKVDGFDDGGYEVPFARPRQRPPTRRIIRRFR